MQHYHLNGNDLARRSLGRFSMFAVAIALLCGGATLPGEGEFANAVVRLTSLVLALVVLLRLLSGSEFRPEWRWPLGLLAATMLLPLVQLIPLPPAIWLHLPGRGEVAVLFETAGMPAPWHPLGLNPEGSLNGFLALIPAAALFIAGLLLDSRARWGVVLVAVVVALAGTVLGLAQVADGPDSELRIYATTNASAAVGFFSNRNHQASLQLAAMPLCAVALLAWGRSGPGRSILALCLGGALFALLAVATVQSESRAGVVLFLPVVGACALLLVRRRLPRLRLRVVLGAVAILALFVAVVGVILLRTNPDVMASLSADARIRALPVVAAEAFRHLPFGSGLGTFDAIYRTREAVETLSNAYLNHAHNDYIEILLETGLAGAVLIGLFLAWFGRLAVEAWRGTGPASDLACAATVVIATLLLHSLVDYPLRTGALSGLFGFACALLLFRPDQDRSRSHGDARVLTGERPRVRLPRGVRSRLWLEGGAAK
jgi:O-antigen ligase